MRTRKISSADDVIDRIERSVYNDALAEKLVEKVERYDKTHNHRDDLTNSEANLIYRDVDFDDVEQLSKKRKLDIDWTGHGKYRSELRDVNHDKVNDIVTERMRKILSDPKKKKRDVKKFKDPGTGTMVVDYDLMDKPSDADIITVYAKIAHNAYAKTILALKYDEVLQEASELHSESFETLSQLVSFFDELTDFFENVEENKYEFDKIKRLFEIAQKLPHKSQQLKLDFDNFQQCFRKVGFWSKVEKKKKGKE